MTQQPDQPRVWRDVIRLRLLEWGPINTKVFIMKMAPEMPPGYAWHRWVVDNKLRQRLDLEEYENPPATEEDMEKAQEALVKWFLRQMRRAGQLIEVDDTVSYKQ